MLVLSRKEGERLVLPEQSVVLTILEVRGRQVRVGISAGNANADRKTDMHKRTVERLVQLAANAPRGLRDTVWAFVLLCQIAVPVAPAVAETLTPYKQLARDIFKELVEINTVSTTGDTGRAADAMAARLRAAGLGAQEVQVFKYAPGKGNLVARLRGTGQRKPILLVTHLDVVPAKPEDWP